MGDIEKIIGLLGDEAIEKQIAAAIVLGELKVRNAEAGPALAKLLDSGVPLLQRHALEALAHVGAKKSLPADLPDARVERRGRAARGDRGGGQRRRRGRTLDPPRMGQAAPDERRSLDAVLAELGGKDAFHTLVTGLSSSNAEAANAAALAMRQQIKAADGRQRRSYLSEIEKFLEKQTKAGGPATAIAAALKILGYLEDESAIPTLLSYAKSSKEPAAVRQEAFIAMRFALKDKTPAKVVEALVEAAESPERTLSQTALHTLGSLDLPHGLAPRLQKLVAHPDPECVRFVLELLGRQTSPDALGVLVDVVATSDKRRAEMAAQMLAGKEAAAPLLAKALLACKDVDRGWILRNVLRPIAGKVPPAARKQLLEIAMKRLGDGERRWEALLDVVRDADPDAVADALRALAAKLRKSGTVDKSLTVMRLLCRSERATDEDRYALARSSSAKARATRGRLRAPATRRCACSRRCSAAASTWPKRSRKTKRSGSTRSTTSASTSRRKAIRSARSSWKRS